MTNTENCTEDIRQAKDCFCEMGKHKEVMDKRRKIHYDHARALMAETESHFCIAEGYLKEAYKLCVDGEYFSELQIVKEKMKEENLAVDNTDFAMDGDKESSIPFLDSEERPLSMVMTHGLKSDIVTTYISDISRKMNLGENFSKRKLCESE